LPTPPTPPTQRDAKRRDAVRTVEKKRRNERDASVRGERDEIGAGVRESGEKKRSCVRV